MTPAIVGNIFGKCLRIFSASKCVNSLLSSKLIQFVKEVFKFFLSTPKKCGGATSNRVVNGNVFR